MYTNLKHFLKAHNMHVRNWLKHVFFHLSLLVIMINFALVSFIYDYCDYDQFNVKNVHGMLNVKG